MKPNIDREVSKCRPSAVSHASLHGSGVSNNAGIVQWRTHPLIPTTIWKQYGGGPAGIPKQQEALLRIANSVSLGGSPKT